MIICFLIILQNPLLPRSRSSSTLSFSPPGCFKFPNLPNLSIFFRKLSILFKFLEFLAKKFDNYLLMYAFILDLFYSYDPLLFNYIFFFTLVDLEKIYFTYLLKGQAFAFIIKYSLIFYFIHFWFCISFFLYCLIISPTFTIFVGLFLTECLFLNFYFLTYAFKLHIFSVTK